MPSQTELRPLDETPMWEDNFCKEGVRCYFVTMQKSLQSNGAASHGALSKKSYGVMHDKQSERDHRELRIDKVGVRGLRFPIQVRDKAHACRTPSRPSACSWICPRNSKART